MPGRECEIPAAPRTPVPWVNKGKNQKMRPWALLFLIGCLPFWPAGQTSAQVLFQDPIFTSQKIASLVYGTGPVLNPTPHDRDLLLDLYVPQGSNLPILRPACIVVFGGYFITGTRDEGGHDANGDGSMDLNTMDEYAIELAKRGYVCASIDYRLMPEKPVVRPENSAFPSAAAFEDIRKAFDWLVANAATYAIDTGRIAIGGYSSGGEVVMTAGYINASSVSYLNSGPLPVRAVFSLSGSMFADYRQWFESTDPPLFLFHGTWDSFIPKDVPDMINARALEVGLDIQYWRLDGEDHFYLMTVDVMGETLLQRIVDFLYAKLDLANIPESAAQLLYHTIPSQLTTNQNFTAGIYMRNNGYSVWTSQAFYSLRKTTDTCNLVVPAQLDLVPGSSVAPGDTYIFSATLQAPSSPQTCSLGFQMARDSLGFGPTVNFSVNIVLPTPTPNLARNWFVYE